MSSAPQPPITPSILSNVQLEMVQQALLPLNSGFERPALVLEQPVEERRSAPHISIAAVKQPLGGLKWHFHCPQSGKPCNVLHLSIGAQQFASRQAHGLAFASQRLRAPARAAVRAQRIRLDLGGSADLEAPFPRRPKGMWASTYERRKELHSVVHDGGALVHHS